MLCAGWDDDLSPSATPIGYPGLGAEDPN